MEKHKSGHKRGKRTLGKRALETLKNGVIDAAILYPAGKTVWAVDSMGRNLLPIGFPQEVRTPIVGVGLAIIPQLFGDHPLTNRISELLLASSLVQTLQTAGNGGTGLPGTIDAQVNKAFQPIANIGMKGYVQNLNGYVESKLKGYVQGGEMRGRSARATLRGLQTSHV